MTQKEEIKFNNLVSEFSEKEKKKEQEQKEANKKKSIQVVAAVVAVGAVSGGAYLINDNIQKNRAEIDQKIADIQKANTPLQESIDWLISEKQRAVSEKNSYQQLMTSAFAQKKNTIELIDAEREVASILNNLRMAEANDLKVIDEKIKNFKLMQNIIASSNYSNKEDLLTSNTLQEWNKISELKKNGLIFENLNGVKSKYENFMSEIVTFEKQYVQVLKEVIASGGYSLNQSQSEIMQQIQKEANATKKEFGEIHKEISDVADAFKKEGQSVVELESAFTEKELSQAYDAVNDMENAALQKAMEDKRIVEEMIAKINNGTPVEEVLGMTGQAPTSSTTTSSSSGSSFTPFLMGMWLGNSMNSSPTYNSMQNTGNSSRFATAVKSTTPSSAYSFKSNTSYVNKGVASNSARSAAALNSAKSKMSNAQTAASRANSLKAAAFRNAGLPTNTKATQTRMAISQARASSISRASTPSAARGGFSGGGGGGG